MSTASTASTVLTAASLHSAAEPILGWLKGIALAMAVLGILIIAGKMITGHWRGGGNVAAEGMSELPWVLLALVLVSSSAALTIEILEPARGEERNPRAPVENFRNFEPEGTTGPEDVTE